MQEMLSLSSRKSFLLVLLALSIFTGGGSMRTNAASVDGSSEQHTADDNSGSSIWIIMAAAYPHLDHRGRTSYYTFPQGCRGTKYVGAYKSVCQGLSGNGWQCTDRTLNVEGTGQQKNRPNDDLLCPTFISCSCSKTDRDGNHTTEQCNELFDQPIDHSHYADIIKKEVCPLFIEACEEDCGGDWSPEKCKQKKCTSEACVANFPTYKAEFWHKFTKSDEGCWTRLRARGKIAVSALDLIAQYQSLAKCCYREVDNGKREFKWMSGNELVQSLKPWKYLAGDKVCPGKDGWHGAKHLGEVVSTEEQCEALR